MRPLPRRRCERRRPKDGSNFGEFAVGIGIILVVFFFPIIDLLSAGVSYMLCVVLNNNQAREARLLKSEDAKNASGLVKKGIPDEWLSGMGKFAKVQGYPKTDVSYRSGSGDDKIVQVSTTITCMPFLVIPLPISNVPALNGPMTFTVATERPMENPDYAGQ